MVHICSICRLSVQSATLKYDQIGKSVPVTEGAEKSISRSADQETGEAAAWRETNEGSVPQCRSRQGSSARGRDIARQIRAVCSQVLRDDWEQKQR